MTAADGPDSDSVASSEDLPATTSSVASASPPRRRLRVTGEDGVPTIVVASDDEADPGHPRAVGVAYAAAIPGARLVTDEPGHSPIAWQGSQLSKLIGELAAEVASA